MSSDTGVKELIRDCIRGITNLKNEIINFYSKVSHKLDIDHLSNLDSYSEKLSLLKSKLKDALLLNENSKISSKNLLKPDIKSKTKKRDRKHLVKVENENSLWSKIDSKWNLLNPIQSIVKIESALNEIPSSISGNIRSSNKTEKSSSYLANLIKSESLSPKILAKVKVEESKSEKDNISAIEISSDEEELESSITTKAVLQNSNKDESQNSSNKKPLVQDWTIKHKSLIEDEEEIKLEIIKTNSSEWNLCSEVKDSKMIAVWSSKHLYHESCLRTSFDEFCKSLTLPRWYEKKCKKRVIMRVFEQIAGEENKEYVNFIRYEENQRKIQKIMYWWNKCNKIYVLSKTDKDPKCGDCNNSIFSITKFFSRTVDQLKLIYQDLYRKRCQDILDYIRKKFRRWIKCKFLAKCGDFVHKCYRCKCDTPTLSQ